MSLTAIKNLRNEPSLARAAVLLTFMILPVWPVAFLAAVLLFAVINIMCLRFRLRISKSELIIIIALGMAGTVSQLGSALFSDPVVPQDAAPFIERRESLPVAADNLLANTDLSWLRGWSTVSGKGAFVTAVRPFIWQLPAVDPVSGERYTEMRTDLELAVEPDTRYTLSVALRHDGTSFDAELVFRTTVGWDQTATQLEDLGDGWLRATAVWNSPHEHTRLRALHLAGLAGDWNSLEVAFAQLVPGSGLGSYQPRLKLMSWYQGLIACIGMLTILVATAQLVRSARRAGYHAEILQGLVLGLGIQALIVLAEVVLHGPGRASGTFGDPNLLAHGSIMVAFTVAASAGRLRLLQWSSLGLACVLIYFSGSDAGLGALIILIAILMIQLLRTRLKPWSVTAVLLFIALVATPQALNSFELIRNDPNTIARAQVWQTTLDAVRQHPLLGIGFGNTGYYHEVAVPAMAGPLYRVYHAHSLLGIGAEFGLVFLVALLVACFLMAWQLYRLSGLLPASVVVVLILLNFMDLTIFQPAVYLSVWITYCMTVPITGVSADSGYRNEVGRAS